MPMSIERQGTTLLVLLTAVSLLAGCQGASRPRFPQQAREVTSLPQLREHVDWAGRYHRLMSNALHEHDKGNYQKAKALAERAELLFPNRQAVTWLVEQLGQNKPIPPGDTIDFSNESQTPIDLIEVRYPQGSVTVRDLAPGETKGIHAEKLPKGMTWLVVDVQRSGERAPGLAELRADMVGSEHGFAPKIIVKPDGTVAAQ